jgi:hypothetical protein
LISRILLALAGFGLTLIVIKIASGSTSAAEPGAFFPATDQESSSIAIIRDELGESHIAFTGYDGKTKDQIVYGVCDSGDCGTSAGNWEKATIPFPGAMKVQLAVTSDGKPRLYVVSRSAANQSNHNRSYSYGECDSDCTDVANWKFAEIANSGDNLLSEVLALRVPDRTFALDGKDRPRFIYTDANYSIEPDHYGAFVMACDADCTTRGKWTETDLALHLGYRHEQFTKPVLALAENGAIGVLANVYAFDKDGNKMKDGLYFYGCATDCTQQANWSRAYVNEIGGGSYPSPTWDLAFTKDGRPRIAQFAGDGTERKDLSHELIYLWCDADCNKEANWNGSTVQPGKGIGESADLALDDKGRPRIAMLTNHGEMALATCDEDCETSAPKWKYALAEPITVPQKERPQALPFHCDGEVWEALMPSLSLNEDSATIGYDMIVSARCLYKDFQEPVPSYTFHEIFRGTRVVTAKFPG